MTPKKRRDWKPVFLATYSQTGNVRLSCHAAGISRTQAYRERQRNPKFAAEWELADEDATEGLESEARRRAMATSDVLLIFLLKARRPEVYRETIRIDLRREAERMAASVGIDPEEAIAEAERILRDTER